MSLRVDEAMMRRAMRLAERGRGSVGTNPLVGAVVARAGRIVGEGWHARFGGPHAEPVALAMAKERARGATLYTTLEPCSHLGKTPPCTRMIIAAGIRRVVIGLMDPTERNQGAGELQRAGIRVDTGVLTDELRAQGREWFVRLRSRRPFVTLKLATTLDGRIADFAGRSKWISSPEARAWTRSMRARADAVLIGAGTVRADDPGFAGDIRVVVDGRAKVPVTATILGNGRTIVAVARSAPAPRRAALAKAGAEVLVVPGRGTRISLPMLMRMLVARGIGSIVCEGGAELAGGLLNDRMVDRVVFVLSPVLLGGTRALSAIGGADRALHRAIRLGPMTVTRLGPDLICEADVLRRMG